jgi:ABC-type nitrate/sulfonate/bicarbonate transport system substrate-binding protein
MRQNNDDASFSFKYLIVVIVITLRRWRHFLTRGTGHTAAMLRVTIAYATPPYTVIADVAEMQGYYRKEGLDAVPHRHSTGKAALNEVLEGTADFATVAETPFMLAIMKGADISIIATIQSSNKNNAVVAKDRKFSRLPI